MRFIISSIMFTYTFAFITNFNIRYKNNYPIKMIANDFMDDPEEKPKIVYRYRGIPPKLCASEEEEKMLEKMLRASNYSDNWVATGGADWWDYPDETLDEETDEEMLYMSLKKNYDNLTIDDKINIALAQDFLEDGYLNE